MNFIGIDGGGTKTAAVLFNEKGDELTHRLLGPCNPNVLGFEESAFLIRDCVKSFESEFGKIDGIYIGTAGIFTADDGPRFAGKVSDECGVERVKCENDVMNVIASATDEDCCVAGVSGTGMIVYAKEFNQVTRFEGWGYLLSSGGSGYDIGRDVLRAAVGAKEGLSEPTLLTRLVEEKSNMPLEELVLEIYRQKPAFVASFAPLAFTADASGDAVAQKILISNAKTFAAILNCAAKKCMSTRTVVVSGGIATNERFSSLLLNELDSRLKLVVPSCPQVAGACINCAKFCGVDSLAVRERLRTLNF
jgi:N-acetylglucosamine kinase-like BadF-type ATPase